MAAHSFDWRSSRRWRVASVRAAVALVLRDGEAGEEALLTLRAAKEGDPWSGHISLPGGRAHPDDGGAVETARRETLEELGLVLPMPIARLPARLTLGHSKRRLMAIDPFVFRWPGATRLTLNHEVDEVFWVPLSALASGEHAAHRPWRLGPVTVPAPAWHWDGKIIWGLTYMMLRDWLRGRRTPLAKE